jgi:pimeloyl-ACP methyl ester carboxylesterase
VLLHGFMETWRSWELVLPALERRHEVLALTLPGHAGGHPIKPDADSEAFLDAVESAIDDAGFGPAHIAGNSLGGYLALRLAARGRALTVVAFAPAGGWAQDDDSYVELLRFQRSMSEQVSSSAPNADALVATPAGRRRATQLLTTNFEHIPAELLAHQTVAIATCSAADQLIDNGLREGWTLDPQRIGCPVRIVWGTEDRLLRWPSAAARYSTEWLPHADWVVIDGVGHCPQLDVPLEAAQLILGFTS